MARKKTHEIYMTELKEKNPYIVPLGNYIDNKTKILHKCLKDGYEWEVRPNSILNGNGCPMCTKHKGGMKLTHEEYLKRVENNNPQIEVLEEYKNNKTKILHRCKIHNYIWKVIPSSILSGHGCPECGKVKSIKAMTKTDEIFKKQVFEKVGNEYTFKEDYQGLKVKLKVIHNECGNEYYVSPDHFLNRGFRCRKCCGGGALKRKHSEEYINDVKMIYGLEYEVIDEYKNNKVLTLHRHNECGYEYYARPDQFLQGRHKCPVCNPGTKQTTETVRKRVDVETNGEYELIGEYLGSDNKTLFRHNICSYEWETTPHNFIWNNSRCPKCASSKGEKRIEEFLNKHNIRFEKEYYFDDLRSEKGRMLRYDFAILGKRRGVKALIEYDGQLHYIQTSLGNDLAKQLLHDRMKSDFAKKKRIPLIRIPYTEFENIEKILISKIKRLNI